MAWGGFAIALFFTYLLQVGVVSILDFPAVDLFLAFALLCSLFAPTHDARIAAFLIGLAQDLGSADALGIHAFTLGLTAVLLTYIRELGNMHVWWVRGLAAVLAAWPGQLLYLLHLYYWAGTGVISIRGAVYAAGVTAIVVAVLIMFVPSLPGVIHRGSRRRYRASSA
ncbi:hypothetical protein [uncultured Ilyobacter sp.]|uniref:hypothetical protein n=1 Tax=uncultured Ilyobacter sp. TaxID=544433 RepID=UPI0029F46E3A|nr:hypothetical protein [uncultured Ilyobacter sp.]